MVLDVRYGDKMKILFSTFTCLLGLVVQAQPLSSPQIMITAEFIAVPREKIASLAGNKTSQIPSAERILALKSSGIATVLFSPTILTQPGQEQTFRSVQEVIYPTRYDATWGTFTNDNRRAVTAAVIKPTDFEMRESGVIFTCIPERFEETDEIMMMFHAEVVSPPIWKTFPCLYGDSSGKTNVVNIEQPLFHVKKVETSVRIKNGNTVLVGGGMNDLDNQSVTYLLITAQLVDSSENPVSHASAAKAELNPYFTVDNRVYNGQLHRRIKDANKIVVRDGGDVCCVSADATLHQKTLFEITDSNEVAQVYQNLKFEPDLKGNDCLCCGHPGIDWYNGTNRVLLTAWKHGRGLMSCGTIAVFTPESQAWMNAWLQRHGLSEQDCK